MAAGDIRVNVRLVEFPKGTRPLHLRAIDTLICWAVKLRERMELRWIGKRCQKRESTRKSARATAQATLAAAEARLFPAPVNRPERAR